MIICGNSRLAFRAGGLQTIGNGVLDPLGVEPVERLDLNAVKQDAEVQVVAPGEARGAREADDVLYTWAGPEIAVATTKAYSTQLTAIYLLSLYIAQERKLLTDGSPKKMTPLGVAAPRGAFLMLHNILTSISVYTQ